MIEKTGNDFLWARQRSCHVAVVASHTSAGISMGSFIDAAHQFYNSYLPVQIHPSHFMLYISTKIAV